MSASAIPGRFVFHGLMAVAVLALAGATASAQWYGHQRYQPPAPLPGANNNPGINQLLSNHDWKDRARAAEQLGNAGDPDAIPALARAARSDPSQEVRERAIKAIKMIRSQSGNLILQPPPNNRWRGQWQQSPLQGQPNVELISNWYRRFLHRAPDPEGMTYFQNLLNNGSEEDALSALLGSDEYLKIQSMAGRTFVQGLYNDILHRGATQQELGYWENQFANNGNSRQALAEAFLSAAQTELNGQPW